MSASAFVVALLGAESTDKTTLAHDIGAALATRGKACGVAARSARFCTARAHAAPHEQAAIARGAERASTPPPRRGDRRRRHDRADDRGLQRFRFGDTSLYESALTAQRRVDLTLVTALDLPWQADGHQRDGAHVREPVDALLRPALTSAAIASTRISGAGPSRLDAALQAIDAARRARPAAGAH
jgi:nicotinamide riboside kinase